MLEISECFGRLDTDGDVMVLDSDGCGVDFLNAPQIQLLGPKFDEDDNVIDSGIIITVAEAKKIGLEIE